MVEATIAIAPPRAAVHHEDAYRWLLVDPGTLDRGYSGS
jgi:hypothetical protein